MASTHSKTNFYKHIALSFLVISVVIAGSIFYVAFSWASVTVVPKIEEFSSTYDMEVAEVVGTLPTGVVAGSVVEAQLEGQGSFSATGNLAESSKARGVVTMVNTTGKDQPLRVTTRVLGANGKLFRTAEFVNVPAGGQVQASVVADTEGDVGQVGERLTIPGLSVEQQAKIYAQSYTPATSGTATAKVVSQDDINQAQGKLVAKLEDSFMAALSQGQASSLGTKDISRVMDRVIVDSTSTKQAGDKAEQFDVKITVKFSAVLFNEEQMKAQLVSRMQERLTPGQEIIPPMESDIRYAFGKVDVAKKTATVKVLASAGKILKQDARIFDRSRLVGKSKEEIQAYFAPSADIAEVKVQFYPFWVLRAPLLEDHINVLVKK